MIGIGQSNAGLYRISWNSIKLGVNGEVNEIHGFLDGVLSEQFNARHAILVLCHLAWRIVENTVVE